MLWGGDMYIWGDKSKERLIHCHDKLQILMFEVITVTPIDISIISGYRTVEEQQAKYDAGLSKKKGGESMHNVYKSLAIDIAPYPIDWKDESRFYLIAGVVLAVAAKQNVDIRWGGDWRGNGDLKGNEFKDLGHYEILNWH